MTMNVSAAKSLREAMDELLTLHKLGVSGDVYKVLYTTNAIENVFSSVRHCEHNMKNYNPEYQGKNRKKNISQRWLAAVFMKAEQNFRTVKGFKKNKSVIKTIEKLQAENIDKKIKAA